MNTIAALNMLVSIMTSVTALAGQAAQVSALIQKAQAEGRTEFTPEEWAQITAADDAARKALTDAIAKASP